MPRPDVSVVVPTYNHAAFIGEALASAFAQSAPPREVVVVDDGSTDGTAEALAPWRDRLQLFRREHGGVAAAYNIGVAEARSEWIAFLESDDVLAPTYLAEVFALVEQRPDVDWVSVGRLLVDEVGRATGEVHRKRSPGPDYSTESLLGPDLGWASTPVVRRAALVEFLPFDERTYGVDTEMALRFSTRRRMAFLDRPLYQFRRHGAATSGSALRNAEEMLKILELFAAKNPDDVAAHRRLFRRAVGKFQARMGAVLAEEDPARARVESLSWFKRAVATDPWRLDNWRRLLVAKAFGVEAYGRRRRRRTQ